MSSLKFLLYAKSAPLLLLCGLLVLLAPAALCQGRSGGGPPAGGGGRGGAGAPMPRRAEPGPAAPHTRPMGAPAGRWWDDPAYARSVGIDKVQQKRMDDVFGANRGQLQRLYSDFKKQEAQLNKASKASGTSEAELDSQIDRVAQARSELQKATTHLQLELRGQLTPDQVNRLETAPQQ